MPKKRICLFGGTFDPIHLGHTAVAAQAMEYLGAEKLVFIPAKRSPLKLTFPQANDVDRMEMISLAIGENTKFDLSDYELKKSTFSYTLETVRYFRAEYGGDDAAIYCLIGADTIDELPRWYGIEELVDCCNLSVMHRAGFSVPDFSNFKGIWSVGCVEKLQQNVIPVSLIDISSTEIRKCLASGGDITEMLTPSVAEYIRKHHLYQEQ